MPVTNCSRRALISLSKFSTACRKRGREGAKERGRGRGRGRERERERERERGRGREREGGIPVSLQ